MDKEEKDVNETDSEFEYVDKDDNHTKTEEESDDREETLLNIVADVIEIEREIDAEASNIVKFSSENISDQPLFLQPEEEDICEKEKLDDEIDGEKLEMEIENHAACLEQLMPKTQSEVEMEDSEESDPEVEIQSEDNSLAIQRGILTINIVSDSTDSDFDHFSNEEKQRFLVSPKLLDHLSYAEDTEYPESDQECVLSDSDVEAVMFEQSSNEQTVMGSQAVAESVISAILNDVLSHLDNIMIQADNENDAIESVNYSNDPVSADVTAVCSAAEVTAVRPSSAPEAGGESVRASSCDDQSQETLGGCEARQSRDNSQTTSRDTECEPCEPNAGSSCIEDRDLDIIQADSLLEESDQPITMTSSANMNEEETEFELYSAEDLDDEMTIEDSEENPSVAKLAELKDWLDSKEKEVNDMFDTNDDCSKIEDLDTNEEGNTETILDVQKDFNIQAEILKQLTESILASTEKREPEAKFSETGEQILDSSSVLITPLTVNNPPGHKSVKKSSGKIKKNSVKSPLLRRKEIRTCINLHNDCENSDVLHEIISPALNFGATSVAVNGNGDIAHPDRRPEVVSRVHQINPDRDESHPCQIEDHRKLDVSCQGGRHEIMFDSVVVVVRIIPLRAKFHAEFSAYFDCISSFSRCQANSDAPECPGSPGRPSPSSFWSAPPPSSGLTSKGIRTSRGQTSVSFCRTLASLTERCSFQRCVHHH